ncbi:hypothetical protein DYB32_003678 [Aphanomyces invadans]|uniref:Uncharacterized protein n=1 Tax=Aphanomyces invadans TaxID=157072 RepID=A0A3R6Z5Z8_9STRA|nr:hypothetical protein DYB32_003678 [Aphanomyces invadans]
MAKRKRSKTAAAAAAPTAALPAEKKSKKAEQSVAGKKSVKGGDGVVEKKAQTTDKAATAKMSVDVDENDDNIEMELDELVAAGGALAQLGAHDAAAELFAKALAMSPENVDIMRSLAKAYVESDQSNEALSQYREIVRLAPQHVASWFDLGTLLVEANDVDGAIEALKRVISLEDGHSAAFASLASCYGEKGDIDAAIALFEGAVQKHPTMAKFHYNLATMLAARGQKKDMERAVDVYGTAARLDPDTRAEVLEDLAELHDAMGDAAKAKAVRDAAANANDDGGLLVCLGDEIYPINLLTEEMRTDETETRIRSMRRLRTIAQALGPERTRSELLPFLSESTDDEDEVLVAMAEELGNFVDLVGGPSAASILLTPLEVLATAEETVVRDKAVASINKVLDAVTDAAELALPLIKRLTEGDWFTSRVSACWIFPVAYSKVDPANKKDLRDLFTTLCADDTPMVRRAAALNIGKFGSKIERDVFVANILPLFKTLTTDDQDSVRLLAIENCSVIAKLLNEDENSQHILPVLAQAMGVNITEAELLHLTSPPTFAVSKCVDMNGRTNWKRCRAAAVSIVTMEIAPKLGEDVTKNSLIPILLQFLRDDVVDARLNVLKRMDNISPWMSSYESTLLPAITDLSKDLQWRVREAVILALPSLVTTLGSAYFQQHLLDMFLNAFQDMVSEVRLSTTKILRNILDVVGSEYILESVLPKLTKIYESSVTYQERVNVFHALGQLASSNASVELLTALTELSVKGASDKIPNVRFTVSTTLEVLGKSTTNSTVLDQVRSSLTALQADSDPDVKYFASVALETVGAS